MKKLLLSCFLALGIGANAQYNYVGDFEGSAAIYGQFGTGSITAAAACTGSFGGQLAPTAVTTQTGWMMQLDEVTLLNPAQTNNSQAATVTIGYKKDSGPVGSVVPMLFVFDEGTDSWSLVQIGNPVAVTSAATTTCATITGTIPAGVMTADGVYGVGAWYIRTSGTGNVYFDNISIVQDIVATAPACTIFTAPLDGSTVGYGAFNMKWAPTATATAYKLTVGTTPGASDVFSGTITGGVTNKFVPVQKNQTYYAKVVPTNANGDATGCTEISFMTNSTLDYCAVDVTTLNPNYERISNVKFANINNPSTAVVAYEDFTSIVANVVKGKTYPMTVTITGFDTDKTSVWIDYNQDGDFSASERVDLTSTASATGNIAIPTTALTGNTRMRIRVNYSTAPEACGTTSYGQVEDYTVNIAEPTLPNCTTVTAAPLQAPNTTLTWVEDSMATGYKVYVGSTPGATDIANGVVVSTLNFVVNGLQRNTAYYAKVVPTNSLGDASGCAEITFTTPANWTYCAATHTTVNADRISNVAFANINNPSTLTTVPGGYENFTAVVGNVVIDGMYPISITAASGNANDKVKVWIDYNQNGVFEDSEMTLLTYASITSSTGNITIPSDALLGNTRMRIRLARQANAASIVACGNISGQGRTQDYTINVAAPTQATASVSKNSVSVYPNPFQDVLKISDVKGVKSISVSDASGRQVKTMKTSAELTLSDLKTGMYIVTLHMEDGTVKTFKTIKK